MTSLNVAAPAVPLWETAPEGLSSAGQEATELAALAGLHLDPWQSHILDVALRERADGKWAARQVALICPRQNGKGSILEAVEMAALFLWGERLVLHSAHEFKTAHEGFLRVKSLVQQTPDLDRLVRIYHVAAGAEGIELKDGRRLKFVARSKGSARGFSADRLILDEAYRLTDLAMAAMIPTMSAIENPQVWFTSSAPLPIEDSNVLRRLCRTGRRGDPNLAYFEFCADDGADPDDARAVAQANPGYPIWINDDAVATDRMLLTDEDFARERLGLWVDMDDESQQVLPGPAWDACISDESAIDGQASFAIEVAEDRSWAAFAAAGRSTVGEFVHGEVVDYRQGTDWVATRAVELRSKWGGKFAVAKSSPAASLIESLRSAGCEVVEITSEDHARSCGQLYDAVVQGRFRHLNQSHLNVAVRGAQRRDSGEAWVWSRRRSTIDISPLVAVTLAAGLHGLAVIVPEPFALRL